MKHLLSLLALGKPLDENQAVEAFELIMTGQATDAQIGALLGMMQLRGPAVSELVGAARVMRSKVTPVPAPAGMKLIDTCGTGGDGIPTFNISTAAAIVVAAVGRPRQVGVAKHGNRALTSKSGSSQVLEALGVRIIVRPEVQRQCLLEAGLCFCFAPNHHPAMKFAMNARQQLGFRTVFNVLGPLTNPAGATRQVMGVFDPALGPVIAEVLAALGSQHAMVVHGEGLDELVTWGLNHVSIVRDGKVTTQMWQADALGLTPGAREALLVDSPQASAAVIRSVLAGDKGPARDIVCLNAAAALVVADLATDLSHGLALAQQALDSGAARHALDCLVEVTTQSGDSAPSI